MTINKHIVRTLLLLFALTSCQNPPDVISADNYYQLRKQLFKYKTAVDRTKYMQTLTSDFRQDTLEKTVDSLANSTILYIDSVKTYLLDYFKVSDPDLLTDEQIKNYNFTDSLFSYITLNSIFCGENGVRPDTKYNAFKLKNVLLNYYKSIPKKLDNRHLVLLFFPIDYKDRKGVIIEWDYQHFFKNNLITTLTNLEKIKHDIYLSFELIKRQKIVNTCVRPY